MFENKISGTSFLAGTWPLDPEKKTLVFIHGAGASGKFWENQVKGLAEAANTIALDLPGHGRSDGPGMDSISAYAGAVASFVKLIRAPSPVPCGLSMGGAISIQLLLGHENLFKAGIFVNTGARLKVLPAIFEMIRSDFRAYLDSLAAAAISPSSDSAILQNFIKDSSECDPDIVYNDFIACDSFDVMDRLGEILLPVLIMTAGDDLLSPPKYGNFMAGKIKNARTANIEKAGHMSPVEKPVEVNNSIRDFLISIF